MRLVVQFSWQLLYALNLSTIVVMASGAWAQQEGQQASLKDNVIFLPVVTVSEQAYRVELTIIEDSQPIQLRVTAGELLGEVSTVDASSFDGLSLSVPSLDVAGITYWANFNLLSEDPPVFVLADAGAVIDSPSPPASCIPPEIDRSNGTDSPVVVDGFSVPSFLIRQGAATDAIPAISTPVFTQDPLVVALPTNQLVIGVKIGDDVRAYPHTIMDWHEVVNDRFAIDGQQENITLSYCPLTGSALLWRANMGAGDPTFGVSGFLYNSNLILYDRDTGSMWSQMLEQSINGSKLLQIPEKLQLIETIWGTWQEMYPETIVMTTETGFSRPYGSYPYGTYRRDNRLLFNAENLTDTRLHRKDRVLGVVVGDSSKVYPLNRFSSEVSVINDSVGGMEVVSTGSSELNFGAVFNRQLEDCTTLQFSALQDQLPLVMIDNEGSEWDVFGTAVTGPRAGTQLQKTNSFIAYWFAWSAFFPGADIQQ